MSLFFSKVSDKIFLTNIKPIWVLVNFLKFKIANVNFKKLPSIDGFVVIKNRGEITIGSQVKINSYRYCNPVGKSHKTTFFCSPKAKIEIGNNVSMSRVLLFSMEYIKIEEFVMLGGGVQVLDSDFHSINFNDRIHKNDCNIISEGILLKRGAFIGADTIILKGVTIGERSVVAASSVVTKNVPDDELWGGNPARFIKKLNDS